MEIWSGRDWQFPMQMDLEKEYHSLAQLAEIKRLYNSSDLTVREALFVVTQLVNHGFPEAHGAIESLRRKLPQEAAADYLSRLALRHAAIQKLPELKNILSDDQVVQALYATSGFTFRPGTTRTSVAVVIFTSKFNNYHISNVVLDALLAELGVARLFLKDTTASIYFRGVQGLCDDLQALPESIQSLLDQKGCERSIITGFSTGGYAALYSALHMSHIGYAGFSTHTNVARSSRLPMYNVFAALRGHVTEDSLLDMSALLANSQKQANYRFYFGDKDSLDRAHALHLSGQKRVSIFEIADAGHQVTSAMMERNELAKPFEDFLTANGC